MIGGLDRCLVEQLPVSVWMHGCRIDFSFLGAFEMVQNQVASIGNSHLKSVLSDKMPSRSFLGA